ncbi:MAG: cobalt-precorrin-6A reductase [Alphaproteobacteria bacterium]|nr:cobalt-precorrin-6A reductase [Alphaproteobacteria bacterium]
MRILILAGTAESRDLARKLIARRHEVTSSLAGHTGEPVLPEGRVRMGEFGSARAIADYLAEEKIELLIDATHAFAGAISAEAVEAAEKAGVPLFRLVRPAWPPIKGARLKHFSDISSAIKAVPTRKKALVTTGQRDLGTIAERPDADFLVRLIDPPKTPLPANAVLLLARPPYTLKSEMTLMGQNGITHLITKNSGSAETYAKLEAAASLGVTILMIDRPVLPEARSVHSVEEAIELVHELSAGISA